MFIDDVRHAFRRLRSRPGVMLAAAVILGWHRRLRDVYRCRALICGRCRSAIPTGSRAW